MGAVAAGRAAGGWVVAWFLLSDREPQCRQLWSTAVSTYAIKANINLHRRC